MQKKEDHDYLYKIILCGDPSVGKTSFLSRYTKNIVFEVSQPTIGIEYTTKCILLKNGEGIVKAQIWDTAGSERYKSVTTAKSVGVLLFYDLTDKQSFFNCQQWLQDIYDNTEQGIVIMLIGNKFDIIEKDFNQRKVQLESVQQFTDQNNLLYYETSAKSGYNVKESFEDLINQIYQKSLKSIQVNTFEDAKSIYYTKSQKENKQECCI